ncbi:MAG TPA: hypothetical protein VGC56_15355 [Allosphingosinicella sp.]|jgi:hypothetical protein
MNVTRLALIITACSILAAPAAAQMRLPSQPPMSVNPPPFGIDSMSSGIPERAAELRGAVGVAFQKGLIPREEAERLSLPLARMLQQLQYHVPRGYRERVRLRQRLDGIQAELDRDLAHS